METHSFPTRRSSDLGATELHLLGEPLLLERGLIALALAGLGRLDAHACLALGTEARFFDRALVIALLANLRFLGLANAALGFLLLQCARFFGTANGMLFFLDAALLDLSELAK